MGGCDVYVSVCVCVCGDEWLCMYACVYGNIFVADLHSCIYQLATVYVAIFKNPIGSVVHICTKDQVYFQLDGSPH